jgi:hypothetical protein
LITTTIFEGVTKRKVSYYEIFISLMLLSSQPQILTAAHPLTKLSICTSLNLMREAVKCDKKQEKLKLSEFCPTMA